MSTTKGSTLKSISGRRAGAPLSEAATDHAVKPRTSPLLVALAFAGFIALGLPGGALNVAWPSIRDDFGLTQDAIGTLLVTQTIGYLVASFLNGRILSRLGIGPFLLTSTLVFGVGLGCYALAPMWWLMALLGLITGLGSGAIDAGLNTYFAANHSPSLMNWLHACFGIGATIGPQLATWILARGHSWRWTYAVVFAVQGVLGIAFALTLKRWRIAHEASQEWAPRPVDVPLLDTLMVPKVWLGIALFVVFTGLEGSAGQWGYVLFTEARKVPAIVAGTWISVYWASLTIGRILFGIAATRIGVTSLLRIGMLGLACGAALVWWNPTILLGFLGLALMGFSLAPLFPLSISDTPRQVGSRHAPNAIGFQVAGASVGLAILPALTGALAQNLGLETIGPFLLVASVLVIALHEVSISRSRRRRKAEAVV